jgi:arylsulfatase A-like enzyme
MKNKLPNIVFIVMDTVGAKHMSLYGYPRRTTPNLDRIAQECTVYTRCFAPSCWTIPSHASMFTGLYPSQHGAHEGRFYLDDKFQHLVSVLKMTGYRTYGISSNGLVSPATGLCRDFDFFKDFGKDVSKRVELMFPREISSSEGGLPSRVFQGGNQWEKVKILLDYLIETRKFNEVGNFALAKIKLRLNNLLYSLMSNPIKRSSTFTEKTIKIFREIIKRNENNQQPFFIFINFMEAHERYNPPRRRRQFAKWTDNQSIKMIKFYDKKRDPSLDDILDTYNNLYDDEIYYLDIKINEIWSILQQSGASHETAVIITSDHGEHLGEKQLYTHMLSLYNDLIWVPLIIRFPHNTIKKGLSDRLVSLNDLYATVLDLIGSPMPRPTTSLSLLSSSERELCLSQYVYPERYQELKQKQAVCQLEGSSFSPPILALMSAAGKKIIEKRDGGLEIFDLRSDMSESNNLVLETTQEVLNGYRNLLHIFKQDTNYIEAVNESQNLFNQTFNTIL